MKPLSLKIKEGKSKIISAINETELPPCIIKMILQDIDLQVERLHKEEERIDIESYENELKEKKTVDTVAESVDE